MFLCHTRLVAQFAIFRGHAARQEIRHTAENHNYFAFSVNVGILVESTIINAISAKNDFCVCISAASHTGTAEITTQHIHLTVLNGQVAVEGTILTVIRESSAVLSRKVKETTSIEKALKILLLVHGIFFLSCLIMPMFGIFKYDPSSHSNGGVIALVVWCIYFLPIGILSIFHFLDKEEEQNEA